MLHRKEVRKDFNRNIMYIGQLIKELSDTEGVRRFTVCCT